METVALLVAKNAATSTKKLSAKNNWHTDYPAEQHPADFSSLRLTDFPSTGGGMESLSFCFARKRQDWLTNIPRRHHLCFILRSLRPLLQAIPAPVGISDRHIRSKRLPIDSRGQRHDHLPRAQRIPRQRGCRNRRDAPGRTYEPGYGLEEHLRDRSASRAYRRRLRRRERHDHQQDWSNRHGEPGPAGPDEVEEFRRYWYVTVFCHPCPQSIVCTCEVSYAMLC